MVPGPQQNNRLQALFNEETRIYLYQDTNKNTNIFKPYIDPYSAQY